MKPRVARKDLEVLMQKMEFDKLVSEEGICLVDFFAEWCAPCQSLSKLIEKFIIPEYGNKIKIIQIDGDDSPELFEAYSIRTIPTIMLFKNGKPETSYIGMQTKENLKQAIDKLL
jgi:thioredoxin